MTRILCLLAALLLAFGTTTAQTPRYTSLTDTTVVRYIRGGYVQDNKLHLIAAEEYSTLNLNRRREILNKISHDIPKLNITVHTAGQRREVWVASDAGVFLMEEWDNDDPQLENYTPLELKRSGSSKMFYYVGGSYSMGDNYSGGNLNLRCGTYLYRDIVDLSATLSMGYSSMLDSAQFTSNIGLDGRYYLPWRPKKINLTPYAGVGMAYAFAPEKYFELRLLVGACWFVGPGNLDFGLQYGIKSGFTTTIGYTFRP